MRGVRAVFVTYLVVLALGITYAFVLGVTGR
jgi:hypothetical protein